MRWYPLFLPATLEASALTLGTEQKADPFKFHSQASSPALTRNRQRLPSCLLIEDVSESGFLPRAPAFGPRHLRSSLSDQRPRNFDLTNSTCIGPGRHRPGEQIVFRSSSSASPSSLDP